jgi:hypothetical protein
MDSFQVPEAQEEKRKWDPTVEFIGEGSRAKTFEHLQIFPILGESQSSGGGATKSIRSTARERSGPLDIHPDRRSMLMRRKYHSHWIWA